MTDEELIKAQAAEIEKLRFDLKRAVKAGVDVAASLSVECNKAALWAREQHASADRYAARIEELEAKLAKAEWLLVDASVQLEEGKIKTRRNRASLIRQFLAELTGAKP